MIFYTINADAGRFCGYHRRWHNLFRRLPEFRWDTFPQHGEVMRFPERQDALNYILEHQSDMPRHCKVVQQRI